MKPQQKMARTALMIAAALLSGPAWAAESAPCATARYRMPDGVELVPEASGVAPADLPASRSGYELPPRVAFDLDLDPVGAPFDESRLHLGRIEIDRETGQSTIDGRPLGGPAEAACRDAQGERPAAP